MIEYRHNVKNAERERKNMNVTDVILAGIGLAMDAVAVGMTDGMTNPKMRTRRLLLIALLFGTFQALMPLLGYALTKWLSGLNKELFETVASVAAFLLLALIGGKMIFDAVKERKALKTEECGCREQEEQSFLRLVLQAVATSIDAFALGISMRMSEISKGLYPPVWGAVALIGAITFALVALGVALGKKVGNRLCDKAEFFGGGVLILIGVKCLLF